MGTAARCAPMGTFESVGFRIVITASTVGNASSPPEESGSERANSTRPGVSPPTVLNMSRSRLGSVVAIVGARPVDGGDRASPWPHGSPVASRAALLGRTDIHLRSVCLASYQHRRYTERARLGLSHPRSRAPGLLYAPQPAHLRRLRRIGQWGDPHAASRQQRAVSGQPHPAGQPVLSRNSTRDDRHEVADGSPAAARPDGRPRPDPHRGRALRLPHCGARLSFIAGWRHRCTRLCGEPGVLFSRCTVRLPDALPRLCRRGRLFALCLN